MVASGFIWSSIGQWQTAEVNEISNKPLSYGEANAVNGVAFQEEKEGPGAGAWQTDY
jgi:hypothetical protein